MEQHHQFNHAREFFVFSVQTDVLSHEDGSEHCLTVSEKMCHATYLRSLRGVLGVRGGGLEQSVRARSGAGTAHLHRTQLTEAEVIEPLAEVAAEKDRIFAVEDRDQRVEVKGAPARPLSCIPFCTSRRTRPAVGLQGRTAAAPHDARCAFA